MDSVLKEVIARNAVRQQSDAILRNVFGFWLGEFGALELIRALDDLYKIQGEVLSREEREWVAIETARRGVEENPYKQEVVRSGITETSN